MDDHSYSAVSPAAGVSLLRLSAVRQRVGLGRSKLYELIAAGDFPAAIHIPGTRAALWPSNAIDQWISELVTASITRG